MVKTFTINVDIQDKVVGQNDVPPIYNQGDINAAILNINITQKEVPYDLTGSAISVYFDKDDGTIVYQDTSSGLTITDAVNGKISVNLNTQTLAFPGKVIGAVKIQNGSTTIESKSFYIHVQNSLTNNNSIKSANYIDSLIGQPNEAEWTATAGQLTYILPNNQTYDPNNKWLSVFVGGWPVPTSQIQKDSQTQFTLLVDPSIVLDGMKVFATFVQSFVPTTSGHHSTHEKGAYDEIDIVNLKNFNEQVATPLAQKAQQTQLESVNVKYPPSGYTAAKGDGTTDDTVAIQALINDFPKVYIPNGTYIVSNLVLKTYRSIIGQSSHDTIIKAGVSAQPSLFVLDVGPIQHVRMENLWFQGIGSSNANQNGLYFKAQADSSTTGGLWLSMFKNIIIKGFDGVQLALRAGSNAKLPHQGLTFERIECTANNATNVNSKALLVEGQTEQITWNECAFSGGSQTQGTNVVLQRERDASNNVVGDTGGNGTTFLQCYFGNALKGITFERSTNMKIYGGYFENLKKCIDVTTSSYGITVEKSEFRTSGTVGDNSGYLIYGDNGSSEYRFIDNEIVSQPENICTGWANKIIKGNRSQATTIIPIANDITDNNIAGDGSITIQSFACRINNSIGLKTINTVQQGNDEFTLISWVAGGFTIVTGGNINVGKTVTINQNDVVTFIRMGNQWWIKNILAATTYHA